MRVLAIHRKSVEQDVDVTTVDVGRMSAIELPAACPTGSRSGAASENVPTAALIAISRRERTSAGRRAAPEDHRDERPEAIATPGHGLRDHRTDRRELAGDGDTDGELGLRPILGDRGPR